MIVALLFSLPFSVVTYAQTPPAETPKPGPYASFARDGIGFFNPEPLVDLKLRFRMQNRLTFEDYDSNSSTDDVFDFAIRRLRLRLDGKIRDPRFGFNLQLSFSRGDMDWDTINFPAVIRDAAIFWRWNNYDITYFGLRKLPGNRQRVISSGQQEFVERSLGNMTFNLDRDVGIHTWHRFFEDHPFWIKLAATGGEGRSKRSSRAGLSYTARLEWLPLGDFINGGDYFEGDLEYETDVKLSLGSVYNINHQAEREAGQIGSILSGGEVRNIENFIADFLFKYRGWAFSGEFFRRQANTPEITATQTIYNGHGADLQLSYTFANRWAPVVRWAQIVPEENLRTRLDEKNQYTVGLTKYLDHHKIKAQADVTLEREQDASTNLTFTNMIYRVQLEIGI